MRRLAVRNANRVLLGVLSIQIVFALGCSSVNRPVVPVTDAVRQEIYRRALNEFERVTLFKPELSDTNSISLTMAPLIFQQAPGLGFTAQKQKAIRTVWFSSRQVAIRGREHRQLLYFWEQSRPAFFSVSFQGIRITLNASGEPAVWEILSDSSGAEIIWVSQALEMAAVKEFGTVLPGRLMSIERAISNTPCVAVASTVDDGPMPMGPILYLAESGDVHVVACRCAALQAQTLGEQAVYRLREISIDQAQAKLRQSSDAAWNASEWFDSGRLESRLRLPREF